MTQIKFTQEEVIIPKEEPKQETVEEASLRIIPDRSTAGWVDCFSGYERTGFVKGAKWQAERMYSEEEVLNILRNYKDCQHSLEPKPLIKWFEQFKKK